MNSMRSIIRKFILNTALLPKVFRITCRLVIFSFGFGYYSVNAQRCPESLSKPFLTESFGSGNQRTLLTSQTTYEYQKGTCPEDGQYTINDFVDGTCFDSVWHAIPEDHTPGDIRGNMLLINSGYEGGEFYRQPLAGVCASTTYEFSFWGINLIKPGRCDSMLPILSAQIVTTTGQLVQTLALGSIPVTNTPTWIYYSGFFVVPDTTTQLVIRLINNKGGCGNDFGIDDIEVRQCSACAPTSLYVPDAFTPNSDGINDEFSIFLSKSPAFDLKIYNQWGNLIFRSNNLSTKWDGTYDGNPCPTGTYTWIINYTTSSSTHYAKTGYVLLVR